MGFKCEVADIHSCEGDNMAITPCQECRLWPCVGCSIMMAMWNDMAAVRICIYCISEKIEERQREQETV